jgi:pimeloyl-ACP methyl ester carboxylesterase
MGFLTLLLAVAPCTTATPGCTEWVTLGGGPARSLVYRSHPLGAKNGKITRALIVIHGASRNADDYFRTGVAAAFLAGALDDTVVIAPRFASKDGRGCQDKLDTNEVSWPCSGNSWRSGAATAANAKLTSYDFTDEILRKLARKSVFPNLKAIVLTGHSAGGQYVSRYVMAAQAHDGLGVPVTYVISNPSSYAYLDAERPAGGKTEGCANYDQWPYGLHGRKGYTERLTDDQLKKNIAARRVVFLLGELDTLPLAGFDSSCQAMAQGPSRLARGQAYAGVLEKKYGAKHPVVTVPMCGHNARCIYTADPALKVLFP